MRGEKSDAGGPEKQVIFFAWPKYGARAELTRWQFDYEFIATFSWKLALIQS
jgi:hypothetical protein